MNKALADTQKYKVKELLLTDYETRNSDITLWAEYLLTEGIIDSTEFHTLVGIGNKAKGNTYESISRARRKVQEENPELASDKMKRIRAEKEIEYHETYKR